MDNSMQEPYRTEASKGEKYGIHVNPKIYIIAFFLFLALIIVMGILTRVLQQGAYDREVVNGVEYLIDDTYKVLPDQVPLPVWRWFTAPFELLNTPNGMKVVLITLTIMIIGGVYAVFDRSGFLKDFISFMVRRFSKRKYLMLFIITLTFILIGSITGIVDNFVLLIPLFVALSFAMGWDSFVGVAMVYVASTRGFAASTLNPYTIGIAQTIADVPLYSGMWLRIIILVISSVAFIWWLLSYARKVERNPTSSLMYNNDFSRRASFSYDALIKHEKRKYPLKEILLDFGKGALQFLPMFFIGLMIMSLSYILTEGHVMDTIVYSLSKVIASSSPSVAALLMLLTTLIVEVFIPGSVIKVYAVMPIFIPIGDLVGLTRQVVCLIYILGDSFVDIIYPTDLVLMVVLGMIGGDYFKWLRWIGILMFGMLAFCVVIILFAIQIGY